jgi:hypothetical protein
VATSWVKTATTQAPRRCVTSFVAKSVSFLLIARVLPPLPYHEPRDPAIRRFKIPWMINCQKPMD